METTINYKLGLRGKSSGVRVWVSGSRVWWCSLGFSALGGSGGRGRLMERLELAYGLQELSSMLATSP